MRTIHLREAAILAIAILNPQVVVQFEHQLGGYGMPRPGSMRPLRDAILRHAIDDPDNLKDHIAETLGPEPLENLLALRHVAVIPCVFKPGDVEKAEMTLAEELAKIKALRGLDAEIAEAEELSDLADEALTYRLASGRRRAQPRKPQPERGQGHFRHRRQRRANQPRRERCV